MVIRKLKVREKALKGTVKPLGVTLKDGSVAGPGTVVPEDLLLGGAAAYDRYMEEKPCRVEKAGK
jgi:hypothetical protein